MISIVITALLMYLAIQLIQRDRDATDMGTVLILVTVPVLLMILGNWAVTAFFPHPVLPLVVLLVALSAVFLLSRSMFYWGWGKALSLTLVFLLSSIGSEILVQMMLA